MKKAAEQRVRVSAAVVMYVSWYGLRKNLASVTEVQELTRKERYSVSSPTTCKFTQIP